MSFDVQIMCGGMLAFVQPSDNQGMLVLAPDHSHHTPIHRLIVNVSTIYQPQLISSQGPVPTMTTTGFTTTWILPSKYEMSVLDGAGSEIPLGAVPVTKNVIVPEFGSDAEILDSGSLTSNLVDPIHLSPIGTMNPVPHLLAFRARLRSGALRAHHTIHREARTLGLTLGATSITKRLIPQALFEKKLNGAHVDLSFKSLASSGDFFVLRLQPAGAFNKIFLELCNEPTPRAFCDAAPNDAGRVQHSSAAFGFLNPANLPAVLPAHQFDSPIYDSIADECADLPPAPPALPPASPAPGSMFGGNKPAICFPLIAPSNPVTW